jgi:protein-disulfide isomerase
MNISAVEAHFLYAQNTIYVILCTVLYMPEYASKPWYKRPLGLIGLGVLVIIAIVAGGFLVTTGYYTYVQVFGNAEEQTALAERFDAQFTSAQSGRGIRGSLSTIDIDPTEIISPHAPKFGAENPQVTIIAFIDFECPFCREAYPSFQEIRKHYSPAVQVVFKHFPISSIHPHAEAASLAAQCASDQDMFWEYYELIFTEAKLDTPSLKRYASMLGLDDRSFSACLSSKKHEAYITEDLADGYEIGVRGTPTYIMNGKKIEGVIDAATWNSLIVSELQAQAK